jgi:hypothetical protein
MLLELEENDESERHNPEKTSDYHMYRECPRTEQLADFFSPYLQDKNKGFNEDGQKYRDNGQDENDRKIHP